MVLLFANKFGTEWVRISMVEKSEIDVAVVGAGFCGIATTTGLRRYGVENVMLFEGGSNYGEFWETNYDRIQLHSPWHDLPDDGGLVDEYPMFKNRREILEYFQRYATRQSLQEVTRFQNFISSIELDQTQNDGRWVLRGNTEILARTVVVATGFCRVPVMPQIPGADLFEGDLLHSKAYRRPDSFAGKRMLVVGSGNSACEIATDLIENGAASVALLVSGGRYFIPLERYGNFLIEARKAGMAGPSAVIAAHSVTPGSREYLDRVTEMNKAILPMVEDLSEFGISQPSHGPAIDLIIAQRVPVLDHGSIPLIRQGAIEVINDRLLRFTSRGVVLAARRERMFDAVILATGFRPGVEEFFSSRVTEYEEDCQLDIPKTDRRCRSTDYDNLYFTGFERSLNGGLSWGTWGFEVAEKIATEMGTFQPEMRPPEFSVAPWVAH